MKHLRKNDFIASLKKIICDELEHCNTDFQVCIFTDDTQEYDDRAKLYDLFIMYYETDDEAENPLKNNVLLLNYKEVLEIICRSVKLFCRNQNAKEYNKEQEQKNQNGRAKTINEIYDKYVKIVQKESK